MAVAKLKLAADAPQTELPNLDDPAELRRLAEEAEIEAEREADEQHLLFERTLVAIRNVARELTYSHCATELERIWGRHGRHVNASQLRAALEGIDRNYFRLEWALWFAKQSDDVAHLLQEMGGVALPTKTPTQELADLKLTLAEEYPKQAAKIIRRGATR